MLMTNAGVFIKLGQHMASVQLLPLEWTSTLQPLQDQCHASSLVDIKALLKSEIGDEADMWDLDPVPIGVASLAQVHAAYHKIDGKKAAVKVQHPDLEQYAEIDMRVTEITTAVIALLFKSFDFAWLAEEMRENLPLEMDLRHEASAAQKIAHNFTTTTTSLSIPTIYRATKRVMIMEFIDGFRVDDKASIRKYNMDPNKISLELSRIFAKMLYLDGNFHGDPHEGNVLLRPRSPNSKSPYNFEIVLLDFGLTFSYNDELRLNYARLWLSFVATKTPEVTEERKYYAKLVGNISDDLYPIFEAAITGRASMESSEDLGYVELGVSDAKARATNVLEGNAEDHAKEMVRIRHDVVNRDGLLIDIFDLLRRVPRRLLMILKVNDLTRHLDWSLDPTHGPARNLLIIARTCSFAVWIDDQKKLWDEFTSNGLTIGIMKKYVSCWWKYHNVYDRLTLLDWALAFQSTITKLMMWR